MRERMEVLPLPEAPIRRTWQGVEVILMVYIRSITVYLFLHCINELEM